MAVSYRDRDSLIRSEAAPHFRWSAIFAGLVAAVATQFLLSAIGAAIGITATTANESADAAKGIGIGAGVWMILSPLISMFVGGLVAVRLARPVDRRDAAFHGGMVWAASMALGALMVGLATVGSFTGLVSGGASAAGNAGAALSQTDKSERQDLRAEIEKKKTEAKKANAKNDKDKDGTADSAENAANSATGAAWAGVLAMLLSLGSAIFGGLVAHKAAYPEAYRDRDVVVGGDVDRTRTESRIVKPMDDDIRPDLH